MVPRTREQPDGYYTPQTETQPQPQIPQKTTKAPRQERGISLTEISKAKEAQDSLVLVDPINGMEQSDLLKKVKEHLNPRITKIRIDGIRATARDGVAIRVESVSA